MGMLFARRINTDVKEVTTSNSLIKKEIKKVEPLKAKSVSTEQPNKVEQSTQPKFKI